MTSLTAAEFFAGIGLMRRGLESAGIRTAWANDIEASKRDAYIANFGSEEFVLGDVRDVIGPDLPMVDLATASFPCTDLSLAGTRRGLGDRSAPRGQSGESSMFWEFARIIDELDDRRPRVILMENVLGFATSNGGDDLRCAVSELNRLGYSCDIVAIDARHFVPQSRPRMFVVGVADSELQLDPTELRRRPEWTQRFVRENSDLELHTWSLPRLPEGPTDLREAVDRVPKDSTSWWPEERLARFLDSLSPVQLDRLEALTACRSKQWRTAYRRTRNGKPVWEIRADAIAGCLRTARGGSSKQALVEAGAGQVRVRWLTPRECARLMGASEFKLPTTDNKALFGLGDAVCVPVVAWLADHYLVPALAATHELSLAV